MAALHAITVTCPACAAAITVPVILSTTTDPVDGRSRGAFVLVNVRPDNTAVREHRCPPPDRTPNRSAAA